MHSTSRSKTAGTTLKEGEVFWRDHQRWLQGRGYLLRARYRPGWVPSWVGTTKPRTDCEDGQSARSIRVLDAIRVANGNDVMLKLVDKLDHPSEADILTFFSTKPLASDPSNHCVPIYEVLQVPDNSNMVIVVMPLLRRFDDPRFDTLGEVVAFFRQIFEGLQFMHKHRVAHRDCTDLHIMMDAQPLYPEPYHPARVDMKRDFSGSANALTRTQRPVKYYFVDFGLASRYKAEDGVPLEEPVFGSDKSVPEFTDSSMPCNPFATDVYCLGNMIRTNFLEGSKYASRKPGTKFMTELVADMVQDDPAKRLTMDEVVARFNIIRLLLNSSTLRARAVQDNEQAIGGLVHGLTAGVRRVQYASAGVPAVPMP